MIQRTDFFYLLYAKAKAFVYLWTWPDKKTHWFSCQKLDKMAEAAFKLNQNNTEVYFGVGGTANKLTGYKRASASEVVMLPGFWVDIDIKGEAHKASNLPATLEEALALLPASRPPTLIVDSGYGIHAYWVFKEPWYLNSKEDQDRASFLIKELQGNIKFSASKLGFKVDTTSDLARVLRVPGTVNHKVPGLKKIAKVLEFAENYYEPEDFASFGQDLPARLPLESPTETPSPPVHREGFVPSPNDGPAELMLNNCIFLKHCQVNANEISYDEWLAALTNLIRSKDGREAVHEFSKLDPQRYDSVATDKKIIEALAMNPQNCDYIRSVLGFSGCPETGCQIKAPCGWSLSKIARAKAITNKVSLPTPDSVFSKENLAALAVLRKEDPKEYQNFKDRCKGKINQRDLDKAVKKEHLHLVQDGEKQGSRWFSDFLEDTPCNLISPVNFSLDNSGVKYIKQTNEGDSIPYKATGDLALISKRLCNIDTDIEKVEISFKNLGHWKTINIERSAVVNSRQIVKLADFGLSVSSETAKYLVKYFDALLDCNKENIPIISTVSKLGWRGKDEFVLPGFEERYQVDLEDLGSRQTLAGFTIQGERESWLDLMQELRQRPVARFILAASFAAPLLNILGQRNFILHNWGNTQDGKTATLWAAMSVWGNPEKLIMTFDSTATAIERKANLFCDLPLAINEREVLNRFKKDDLSSLLYMLGEGKGRGRGDKRGLQGTATWKTVVLSTGENTLLNSESLGGAITRVLEIYGGAFAQSRDFARSLYQILPSQHGYAGRDFLKALIDSDKSLIIDVYKSFQNRFRAEYPDKLDAHLDAVACVATADYLASGWIFNEDWDKAYQGALQTASHILTNLISQTEASESKRAWEDFNDYLAANAERFTSRCSGERLGLKEGLFIYVIRNKVNDFLKTRDQNPRKILKDWAEEGKIESFNESGKVRYDKKKKFGDYSPRMIKVKASLSNEFD